MNKNSLACSIRNINQATRISQTIFPFAQIATWDKQIKPGRGWGGGGVGEEIWTNVRIPVNATPLPHPFGKIGVRALDECTRSSKRDATLPNLLAQAKLLLVKKNQHSQKSKHAQNSKDVRFS